MGKKLFLRTCNADGSSRNGFIWPTAVGSEVICPDWDPKPECGNGLHGLLDGGQNGSRLSWNPSALWMAVEADESDCTDLGDKWKFSRCVVVAAGTRKEVTDYMVSRGCMGVHGATLAGGDEATLTGGNMATLTGGDVATLTGGDGATLTGGDGATLTGGDEATLAFLWWDKASGRKRLVVAYVGEGGILPNVAYRLNAHHVPEAVE